MDTESLYTLATSNADTGGEPDANRRASTKCVQDDLHEDAEHKKESEHPYSILTNKEKYFLCIFVSMTGVWSALSTSIYFPALSILSEKFNVSLGVTNVSVVAYLLMQGISPAFLSPLADAIGRRPMTILCLLCYCGVCVGLSQTNVYWLLVVLRLFQAAAIAPLVSISSGVVGDICPRSERGNFMGIATGIQLVGQGFGALVGAGVVSRFGWRGIFELLAIGSGGVMIMALFVFPETNRLIVGNMSIPPKYFFNQLPILHLPSLSKRLTNDLSTKTESNMNINNVLSSFRILFQPKVLFILLPGGLIYTSWTMALTTLSTALTDKYGYTIVHVGLCYLAPGLGSLVGALTSGRLLNYAYKIAKNKYDEEIKDLPKEEIKQFDIYRTRLNTTLIPALISCSMYILYGWCIQYKVNIAPALIAAFMFSFCTIFVLAALMTLLVDLFPNQSSAGASCVNLLRCLLGAAGVGALQSMVDAMGEGGCYTLMAGFSFLGTAVLYLMVQRESKRLKNIPLDNESDTS